MKKIVVSPPEVPFAARGSRAASLLGSIFLWPGRSARRAPAAHLGRPTGETGVGYYGWLT